MRYAYIAIWGCLTVFATWVLVRNRAYVAGLPRSPGNLSIKRQWWLLLAFALYAATRTAWMAYKFE